MLPKRIQLKLLQKTFWSADYYNTWIMYVGITGGKSFTLKHFLSGNRLQIFTRIFKAGISHKFLNNKIKCLHIFQCLVEAQNTDLMSLFGRLFQNQEIDLSGQTLLPRDLNTLGFLLVRSINKHWKKLDLSRCYMGDIGLKILTEFFVDKFTHSGITIDRVDFSYNQLDFSCLAALLKLHKTWKTSEIIINDNSICSGKSARDIFGKFEHIFFQPSDDIILKTLLIGSFLFAYKLNESQIVEIFTKTQNIEAMYLIRCKLNLNVFDTETLLRNQRLMRVHIFGEFVSLHALRAVISAISHHDNNPSLVINDHTLSDEAAEELNSLLPVDVSSGVVLLVSATKVQGVIKPSSLSSELSDLEILNLIHRIRTLCSSCVPVVPSWDHHLQWYGHKSEGIIETFVKVLFLNKSSSRFQLKIGLVERNSLIAHAMRSEEINEMMSSYSYAFLSSIYLSSCIISSSKWINLVIDYNYISSLCLYMIDCEVEVFNMLLSPKTIMLRELFVHSIKNVASGDIEAILFAYCHASVVVVTKDIMAVCNPTNKQLAMAHQLEPSVTVWKFLRCKLNSDTYKQIIMLLAHAKLLNELKFVGCDFRNSEIEMLFNQLVAEQTTLHSSSLLSSIKALASSLTKLCINQSCKAEAADDIAFIILNTNALQVLNLGDNDLKSVGIIKIMKALQNVSSLTELLINNNSITEEAADDIAAVISNNKSLEKLDLGGNFITTDGMNKIVKALQNFSTLTRLHVDGNQLTSKAADDLATFIKNNTKMQVFGCGKIILTVFDMINIAKALQSLSTLTELFINDNQMDESAADDIGTVIFNNKCLQKLDLSGNSFTTAGIITIAEALLTLSSLTELYISNNGIDCITAECVAAVILSNTKLQKLNLNNNGLQAVGAIKIAKALQYISSLTDFYINSNQITEEAASDIAAVILSNTTIQKLDLSGNCFQTAGIIKIAQALQTVSSVLELYIHDNLWYWQASDDIAAVILSNPKLQKLDLSDNYCLGAYDAIKIAKALQNIASLTGLHINGNKITDKAVNDLLDIIRHNRNLEILDLSDNEIDRTKIAQALQSNISLDKYCIYEQLVLKKTS